MTAPFPTFPCGGCSLIPTSSSVQTHKAWREVGKDFLPPPAVPCIPSQTVLRETPSAPSTSFILDMGYRKAELLEEQTQ